MVTFFIRDKNLKSTSIRVAVNVQGVSRYSFTLANTKISPNDWGVGQMNTGRGKTNNGRIQSTLNKFKEVADEFHSRYFEKYGKYPNKEIFMDFLKTGATNDEYFLKEKKVKLIEYFNSIINRRIEGLELVNGRNFSSQTVSTYKSLILALEEFKIYKNVKEFYLEDWINIKLIDEFEVFLSARQKMMLNTIHNRLKVLKAFLTLASNDGLIRYNPFIKHKKKLSKENSDVVVFTVDEVLQLEELDFSNNPYYDKLRDQYLFYLWSGVRKGDLKNLIQVINPNTNVYSFRSSKTKEVSEIPAFEPLVRLGKKYNYDFPKPYNDVVLLAEIKNICKLIPSMNVIVEKNYTRAGKTVRDYKMKYEMVCIHTARRSFATMFSDAGLDFDSIMKMTGHKKLGTLQNYIKSTKGVSKILEIGNSISKR
ncbi:MAG TPA: site-specific integrase [Leadbetterella sp.]|nr:site-specific integrase [Leadbetterella sp.]